MKYDFSGWATKNDLKCTDGRVIKKDAFKVNDGKTVPLVWNHQHNAVENVLGHAQLFNRPEGVFAYCSLNNTPSGKAAKEAVAHKDVVALSICANNLEQIGPEVIHGCINEVSLVLAGANPGAFIESVLVHSEPMEDGDSEGIFYTGESILLQHSDSSDNDQKEKDDEEKSDGEETVADVFNTLSEKQKKAVAVIVGAAIADQKSQKKEDDKDDKEDEKEMRHNIFDKKDDEKDQNNNSVLIHSDDMKKLMTTAQRMGSLKTAFKEIYGEDAIVHAVPTTGMTVATGTQTYGFNDPSMLFPDYKSSSAAPEWISRNQDWVTKVLAQVHRSPFSRIKSVFANITEDEARARGYIKGKLKKEEVFTTLKRTTGPQTIYKKQKLDRDDVIDITEFDVLAWIRAEMRVMLNEEIARAILIGDGRPSDSEDKIQEINVRPVISDVALFNTVVKVEVPATATSAEVANETIKAIIRARKNYKGSGSPTFWTTEDTITEMLLIENGIGEAKYRTEGELATALRVKELVPVEPMEGMKITINSVQYPLIGTVVNLSDYNVGADKGGEINNFEDFDIDYNQQKYLIETRISGALVKPFAAITLVLDRKAASSGTPTQTPSNS